MTFPETVQAAHTSSGPWQPQLRLCPLADPFPPGARLGPLQLLQPGGGRRNGASACCGLQTGHAATSCDPQPHPARVLPPAALPERRLAPPRPPRSGRGMGGGAGARRTRAGGVAGSWLPRLRQAGTLAPRPRPEPPGASRARTRCGRAGPVSSARVLGSRPGRNIPGSPRPAAPVPAPPPPRVFRPSKDRATQISLGCPLPSGPFSGRVSGAAKSLVFSPKWKMWGAGAAGAASNCSARSNSCQ